MQVMTCKNCLAPINPHLDHCEYCGGYFEKRMLFLEMPTQKVLTLKENTIDLEHKTRVKQLYEDALYTMRAYDGRIMTPNEMRATMGLDPLCHATYNELGGNGAIEKPKKKLFGFRR